jgi:hypothetical protein
VHTCHLALIGIHYEPGVSGQVCGVRGGRDKAKRIQFFCLSRVSSKLLKSDRFDNAVGLPKAMVAQSVVATQSMADNND